MICHDVLQFVMIRNNFYSPGEIHVQTTESAVDAAEQIYGEKTI